MQPVDTTVELLETHVRFCWKRYPSPTPSKVSSQLRCSLAIDWSYSGSQEFFSFGLCTLVEHECSVIWVRLLKKERINCSYLFCFFVVFVDDTPVGMVKMTFVMWDYIHLHMIYWYIITYLMILSNGTLCETNISSENRPSQKEISSSNHPVFRGYVSFREGGSMVGQDSLEVSTGSRCRSLVKTLFWRTRGGRDKSQILHHQVFVLIYMVDGRNPANQLIW